MSLYIILIIMLFSGVIGGWINSMLSANIDPATKKQIQSTAHCILIGIGATILVPLFLQIAQSSLLDNIHAGFELQDTSAQVAAPKSVTDKKAKTDTGVKIDTSKKKDTSTKLPANHGGGSTGTTAPKDATPKPPAADKPDDKAKAAVKDDGLKAYLIFMAYCFLAAAAGPRFINNLIDGVIKDKQIANLNQKNEAVTAEKQKVEAEKDKVVAEKDEIAEEKDKVVEQKNEIEKKQSLQKIENHLLATKEEKQVSQTMFTALAAKDLKAPAKPQIKPVTVKDDPQKGRFGGESENNGRALKATVTERKDAKELYDVTIWVESTDPQKPLDSDVVFYLHDSFRPAVYTIKPKDFKDGRALDDLISYGAFTVGAVTDNGSTLLELDLAKNSDFPEVFRLR
jgi:hypothetical protein